MRLGLRLSLSVTYIASYSYRVRNGAHPSHSSTLHFCDVVFAWYLPEMCAARHDMVQIASGCAAHTVFFSHGSPTDVSLPGWQRPACPERTRLAVRHVRHGSVSPLGSCSFGWMSYFFRLLWVASHWFCHFVTRASAGLHRRGWEVEMKLLRERKRLFTGWW